jgi:hypothetical protein
VKEKWRITPEQHIPDDASLSFIAVSVSSGRQVDSGDFLPSSGDAAFSETESPTVVAEGLAFSAMECE